MKRGTLTIIVWLLHMKVETDSTKIRGEGPCPGKRETPKDRLCSFPAAATAVPSIVSPSLRRCLGTTLTMRGRRPVSSSPGVQTLAHPLSDLGGKLSRGTRQRDSVRPPLQPGTSVPGTQLLCSHYGLSHIPHRRRYQQKIHIFI